MLPCAHRACCRLNALIWGRQLGRSDNVGYVSDAPAAQLSAIAEIEILRQRVPLPSTGVANALTPPHASAPVEVHEQSAAAARCLLDNEVSIHAQRLHARERRVLAVQVPPARLDTADLRIGEGGHDALDEVLWRNKVRAEHRDELPFRHTQPSRQFATRPPMGRPCCRPGRVA